MVVVVSAREDGSSSRRKVVLAIVLLVLAVVAVGLRNQSDVIVSFSPTVEGTEAKALDPDEKLLSMLEKDGGTSFVDQAVDDEESSFGSSSSSSSKPAVATNEALSFLKDKRTLVVYSGPTTTDTSIPKSQLYTRNFEYFLETGVECDVQDTLLVVTEQVAAFYAKRVDDLNDECRKQGHRVRLVVRENVCHDMESVRVGFATNVVNTSLYDYFVYVNCGMTGPPTRAERNNVPWTYNFTSKHQNKDVAMSGLSHNCYSWAHLQSHVYSFNRVGLEIVLKEGAIYDCRKSATFAMGKAAITKEIIARYEMGMSRAILNRGFAIATLMRPSTLRKQDWSWCGGNYTDIWAESKLEQEYGRLPNLTDILFFKTSRLVPEEMRRRIKFEGKVPWHWK